MRVGKYVSIYGIYYDTVARRPYSLILRLRGCIGLATLQWGQRLLSKRKVWRGQGRTGYTLGSRTVIVLLL